MTRPASDYGYFVDPGPRGPGESVEPMVGALIEMWRPSSHRGARVEHTELRDGVWWGWCGNNRWFPDAAAYPKARYCWKAFKHDDRCKADTTYHDRIKTDLFYQTLAIGIQETGEPGVVLELGLCRGCGTTVSRKT